MASFRKRLVKGKARWDATVTRRGAPRQTQTFHSQAAAQRWARETERDIERGAWCNTSMAERTTLGELLGRYVSEVAPTKRSPDDIITRTNRILKHDLAKLPLISLRPERLAVYRDMRLKSQVQVGGPNSKTFRAISPQTVRHEMALIRAVIRHAMREWGLTLPSGDPVQHVRLPPQSAGRERRTEGNEYERILAEAAASRAPRLAQAIEISTETAMRRGEICNLRWSDVDLDRRVARCRMTKNGEPRDVPLSRRATEVLAALPRRQGDAEELVFAMKPDSYTQAFKRICERLGLKNLRLHDLRHEGASRLAEKLNGDVIALSSVTGHKTLSMLQRYTHLRAQDVAKRLD